MAKEKEVKKEKRPTAIKRDLQNERRRLATKAFRSTVGTALRTLNDTLKKGDAVAAQESLNHVFSLMDKGVKKGRFKMNRANRLKSRLHRKAQALKTA